MGKRLKLDIVGNNRNIHMIFTIRSKRKQAGWKQKHNKQSSKTRLSMTWLTFLPHPFYFSRRMKLNLHFRVASVDSVAGGDSVTQRSALTATGLSVKFPVRRSNCLQEKQCWRTDGWINALYKNNTVKLVVNCCRHLTFPLLLVKKKILLHFLLIAHIVTAQS